MANGGNKVWGFLRETPEGAKKENFNEEYQVGGTSMIEYLKVIFPDINENDWIHDKVCPNIYYNGRKRNYRPDFRNERTRLIIEFDGIQHYTNPDNILKDEQRSKVYMDAGYNVVRIPYFIQLTNEVVKKLFGIDVQEPLFDENIPSIGVEWRNTPAYLCPAGIKRMAEEYHRFPQQYEINLKNLKDCRSDIRSGYGLLCEAYKMV